MKMFLFAFVLTSAVVGCGQQQAEPVSHAAGGLSETTGAPEDQGNSAGRRDQLLGVMRSTAADGLSAYKNFRDEMFGTKFGGVWTSVGEVVIGAGAFGAMEQFRSGVTVLSLAPTGQYKLVVEQEVARFVDDFFVGQQAGKTRDLVLVAARGDAEAVLQLVVSEEKGGLAADDVEKIRASLKGVKGVAYDAKIHVASLRSVTPAQIKQLIGGLYQNHSLSKVKFSQILDNSRAERIGGTLICGLIGTAFMADAALGIIRSFSPELYEAL